MSDKVELREVIQDDLLIFFQHQQDPVATQLAAFQSRDLDAFMAHWAKIMADESVILRTILSGGQVAGNVVSFVRSGRREVGYWLGREFWGRGIATKALAAFLEELTMRPLYGIVAKHNAGSRRVLEKCGFTIVGDDRASGEQENGVIEEFILKLE